MEIRNVAIIAHVDHGKTTLTDALLRQAGAAPVGTTMDSNALEQERGITIYSKNASLNFRGTKINLVDTPGHADFGSEVERVLQAVEAVLLVVDAQEGPMPQTRFVLKKSLALGLKPLVIINKIDKPAADPARVEEEVLELFLELGASNEQADFPVVYASSRQGIAKLKLTDESSDLTPLLEAIIRYVPVASAGGAASAPLIFQTFNLGYDNFLGRLALGRVYSGRLQSGVPLWVKKPSGEERVGRLSKIFTFAGLERQAVEEVGAGDIALIAGLADIDIGETVTDDQSAPPRPAIKVDEPTIHLTFLVNNSPFAGREGKHVTSRELRAYLERELEVNVGLRVDFSEADSFEVAGRGELHIAILLENMRRAGYEVQVSQPEVIRREVEGVMCEPFEEVVIDVPREHQGVVIERLGSRGFSLKNLQVSGESVRLSFEGPLRGLLGFRNQFVVETKGEGIFASRFLDFRPEVGGLKRREAGSMISMASGKALGYSLWNLQDRGTLYIGPGTEVYEGMVIGNTAKGEEMTVNPTKGKQLSNVRASGTDEAIDLVPPLGLSIERGLEIMAADEYLEITPKSIRLRKQELIETARSRARRQES